MTPAERIRRIFSGRDQIPLMPQSGWDRPGAVTGPAESAPVVGDIVDRMMFLPFGQDAAGNVDMAFPQAAVDVYDAMMMPGRIYQGEQFTNEDAAQAGLDLFGMGMAGSLALAPRHALGSGPVRPSNALPMDEASRIEGIRAYHGSPHTFDQFRWDDTTRGTGEGAQAYGDGLYFAESEDVARGYRDRLTAGRGASPLDTARRLVETSGNREAAIAEAQRRVDDLVRRRIEAPDTVPADSMEPGSGTIEQALELLRNDGPIEGSMYEVRLNASPDDFLDWDAPLSEQPEMARRLSRAGLLTQNTPEGAVRSRVGAMMEDMGLDEEVAIQRVYDDLQGEMSAALDAGDDALYDRLMDMDYAIRQWWDSGAMAQDATGANPSAGAWLHELERSLAPTSPTMGARDSAGASVALREAGIPGLRYFDGNSRGAGEGTRNYVVWDDSIIEILRRYGILPPIAVGTTGYGLLSMPGEAEASQ